MLLALSSIQVLIHMHEQWGVTVVTDDSLVKAFLQDTNIPINNYLLKGNDLLSFVLFSCFDSCDDLLSFQIL